jgi:hypothetical protein
VEPFERRRHHTSGVICNSSHRRGTTPTRGGGRRTKEEEGRRNVLSPGLKGVASKRKQKQNSAGCGSFSARNSQNAENTFEGICCYWRNGEPCH